MVTVKNVVIHLYLTFTLFTVNPLQAKTFFRNVISTNVILEQVDAALLQFYLVKKYSSLSCFSEVKYLGPGSFFFAGQFFFLRPGLYYQYSTCKYSVQLLLQAVIVGHHRTLLLWAVTGHCRTSSDIAVMGRYRTVTSPDIIGHCHYGRLQDIPDIIEHCHYGRLQDIAGHHRTSPLWAVTGHRRTSSNIIGHCYYRPLSSDIIGHCTVFSTKKFGPTNST